MIKIICDSMSDVPKEIVEKFNIHVLPARVSIEGKEYFDGVDLTSEEFFKILRESNGLPKTSQVTYAQFKEAFDLYIDNYDEILYVGGSSRASGTYQSAILASRDVEGKGTIYPVDTYSFSAGGGVFVIKACMLAEEGKSAKEIVEILENLKGKERVFLTVDDLKYLKMGGRISGLKATVGTLLNIKPIITLKDGLADHEGQIRGKKKSITAVFNKAVEGIDDLSDRIIIYGGGDIPEDIRILEEKVLSTNCKNIYRVSPGLGITSNTGPGIVGLAVL
ncbi:MAG: DegV family protein [Terrisporobacter sp.]|uniref:DegV family protein n=1 Tax=Terrisporobacter sp. TaxID=1965305 RepID=UPI002FC9554B